MRYFLGTTKHLRLFPRKHHLQYSVFWFCVELCESSKSNFSETQKGMTGFCKFKPQHHGEVNNPATSLLILKEWVIKKWQDIGLTEEQKQSITSIQLHTFPSVGGYVFKPVSFYVAYHNQQPIAFLAEVNNTFGERFCYPFLLSIENVSVGGDTNKNKSKTSNYKQSYYFVLETNKMLHVSPFNQIEGFYRFRLWLDPNNPKFFVLYFVNSLKLIANLQGKKSNKSLFYLNIRYPLQSIMVIVKIHYHALLLLYKKIPFFGKKGDKIKGINLSLIHI
jgi:DUF1365 family protein